MTITDDVIVTDDDLRKLHALTSATAPICTSHDGKICDRCSRAMIVDGYVQTLRSCRVDVDAILASAVPTLLDEIERLYKDRDHWRNVCAPLNGKEMIDIAQGATKLADKEIKQLRGALAEALDLFDDVWCPAHGHAPKPEQITRAAELRKLVGL